MSPVIREFSPNIDPFSKISDLSRGSSWDAVFPRLKLENSVSAHIKLELQIAFDLQSTRTVLWKIPGGDALKSPPAEILPTELFR